MTRALGAQLNLRKLKESKADAADNTAAIADELIKAVNTLSSLEIRRDKFPLTPESIYDSLLQDMHYSKQKLRDESKRREALLNAPSGDAISSMFL